MLLAAADREGRGRLTIFLGMAPGVGKTYTMLETARRLKADDRDVAVGVVETHGRAETQALLEGLEVLPRRIIPYHGHDLQEFDLDAALKRKPQVLLLDELAHSNAPDCRHPKRWQDAEELLRAGIDVLSTLNVQHIESLNDVVARITGVRVQETVPDRVLDEADEVELVDLTPAELTDRLEDGKVYVANLAAQAREGFFRPGNLTALRELALRRTAERVNAQMVGYMRSRAIEGPWPASERLMVCIGPDGLASAIVLAGNRMAEQLKAPWVTIYVEPAYMSPGAISDIDTAAIEDALSLAERLQSRTERLIGLDLPGEILAYARRNNVTQILIGRSRRSRIRELFGRSLVQELIRKSEGIAIHVVTAPPASKKRKSLSYRFRKWVDVPTWPGILTSLAGLAGVVGLAYLVPSMRQHPNVSMLFLAIVLYSAIRHGRTASLFTAVVAFCIYNFFFATPLFSLQIANFHDVITLLVFLVVAATSGSLAGRVRDQASAAQDRMSALQLLYDFSRRLGAAKSANELLHAVVLKAHRLSGMPTMVLLPEQGSDDDDLLIRYAWPPDDILDTASTAAARWTYSHAEPAGTGTDTLPAAPWHFRPMRTGSGVVGVFGMRKTGTGTKIDLKSDLIATLDAMLDQSAVAIERITFAEDASSAATAAATERFRNVLLSSVSHDLRTPLTSILGSVTALRQAPTRYNDAARDELLATIQEETERLENFVTNLLDITRLESGVIEMRHDWIMLSEIINSSLQQVRSRSHPYKIIRRVIPEMLMIHSDYVLLQTVLVNLIDNAIKHAQQMTTIDVSALRQDLYIDISVTDDGDGVPPEHLPHLFDKFYRIRHTDHTTAGTGLGLSIAKGIIEAMNGSLTVESPIAGGRGTRFTIRLPFEEQPKLTDANKEPADAQGI
ncbi:sensor histidine kinase [Govanella unica]|uniref:histidine kinase n=1 Tax=Govanella unica TaxID=2975056 RepID=A0A9X3TZN1_9PROT|nr:sensor histidine kinase KdpD [Govania unica]